MKAVNPSQALAVTLADEFVRNGVTHAVLAPGSRSAPLALALAADERLTLTVSIDERSASFLALGLARATGGPALLVCTSGTAAANFLPAIIEASNDGVPLVVLTADRPPELRGTAANQTIDQIKLYGDAVRWFCEVGVPDGHPGGPRHWRSTACRAVAEARGALGAPRGPVHLNLSLREPLVSDALAGFELDLAGRPDSRPWTNVPPASRIPQPAAIERLVDLLATTERGIIVAGAGDTDAGALLSLARRAGYPVLAEPSSNARTGDPAVAHYEALLRHDAFSQHARADLVLRFGKTGLSRALGHYLETCGDHITITRHGMWLDPQRLSDEMIVADPGPLCDELSTRIPERTGSGWARRWADTDRTVRVALDDFLDTGTLPTEPRAARDLAACLPDGSNLVVASSMPVRDLDAVMAPRTGLQVFGNRGANGIDGFVSTALGIALGSARPTAALCGDLALLHDQNGLLLARDIDAALVFVVLNNDGGGIFSFLEQSGYPEHFERVFGTPHGIDFEDIARTYGCGYARIDDAGSLASTVTERLSAAGVHLVEVRTDRRANVEEHRKMYEAVVAALGE